MVEYVFENKKISQKTTLVAAVCAPRELNDLKKLISEDEHAKILSKIKANDAKQDFVVLEGIKRKMIVCFAKGAQNACAYQVLGAKIYRLIKNESEVVVFVSKAFEKTAAYDMAFGIELESYRFDKYHTKLEKSKFAKLEKVFFKTSAPTLSADGFKNYAALANAVRYARDLINEPSNNMTPEIMAHDIKRLEYLGLKVELLDEKKMKEQNFNLALSVAQGSINKPYVAIVKWNGNKAQKEYQIGLVGKGVTFDSGGISLKPSNGMWDMKQDMAGAAAVVGALKAAALQKLPINVIGVVGLVENMPSGSATRPGDVVTSMSSQTVEILNTDAEGRLVLADCLWYIQSVFGVKKVVDIATLTGAISVALGSEMAGIMGNSQKLVEQIKKAGVLSGEQVWQLPLGEAYNKMMDSDIADMKNISESRGAGSITAACFLERFIQKGVAWAHIDIAGVDKETKGKPLNPKGATGFGVRLFNALLQDML